ncbi:MAG: hypothetical protein ACFFBP_18785 [Promethearchaeota archaeon]
MSDELNQLKFIASMFRMAMEEISTIMGEESVQVIYRLLGEKIGESVAKRIQTNTVETFSDKFLKDVLFPALGDGGAEIIQEGNTLTVILKVCPFQRAGIDISNKFYCTYTEGLIETAAKQTLGEIEFKSEKLRATDNCDCTFKIIVKS